LVLGPTSNLFYPILDVFTLCSIGDEGFPNELCEAMARDVPCVTTDVRDSAEIIGDSGLIVPRQEPKALAGAWRTLIEWGLAGEGAWRCASALSKMCAHYEALIARWCRRRHRRDWH
jgi:glycosyltransferase involved in cell wall biosynthesis